MLSKYSSEKSKESSVRKKIWNKYMWLLKKSRTGLGIDNFGEYMIVDACTNSVVVGEKFNFSLDDVIEFADL